MLLLLFRVQNESDPTLRIDWLSCTNFDRNKWSNLCSTPDDADFVLHFKSLDAGFILGNITR